MATWRDHIDSLRDGSLLLLYRPIACFARPELTFATPKPSSSLFFSSSFPPFSSFFFSLFSSLFSFLSSFLLLRHKHQKIAIFAIVASFYVPTHPITSLSTLCLHVCPKKLHVCTYIYFLKCSVQHSVTSHHDEHQRGAARSRLSCICGSSSPFYRWWCTPTQSHHAPSYHYHHYNNNLFFSKATTAKASNEYNIVVMAGDASSCHRPSLNNQRVMASPTLWLHSVFGVARNNEHKTRDYTVNN